MVWKPSVEQKRKWSKKYRETHKEQIAEKNRLYKQMNREKVAAYSRTHYWKNPEKRRAQAQAYRLRYPEKVKAQNKKNWERNKEYYLAAARAWKAKNPKRIYEINRKMQLSKYSMTPAQFDLMFSQQEGICAICKLPSKRTLHVDHDHQTGRVRGLLCDSCNLGLGKFKDNQDLLLRAAAYLLQ